MVDANRKRNTNTKWETKRKWNYDKSKENLKPEKWNKKDNLSRKWKYILKIMLISQWKMGKFGFPCEETEKYRWTRGRKELTKENNFVGEYITPTTGHGSFFFLQFHQII